MSVTAAQPKVDVEEASRRDFSLKPNEAADTIIALAICRRDSFRGRAAGATNLRVLKHTSSEIKISVYRLP